MRKGRAKQRRLLPDPKFNDTEVTRFVNDLMMHGKKTVAFKIFYDALDKISEKVEEENSLDVFKKGLKNVTPAVEVRSRRVGGANYQVPIEIRPSRRQALAMRWIVDAARKRSEKSMNLRLAGELMDASQKKGSAVRKREDVHKMAEANKAFSHFRF